MDEERLHKRLETMEVAQHELALTVARLSSQITSEFGNNNRHLEGIYKIIGRHDLIVLGDGGDRNIGLLTRVDRIEQSNKDIIDERKSNLKVIWSTISGIIIAVFSLIGKWVYDLVTQKGN